MGRLLRFFYQVLILVVCFVFVTIGWIIFDGLNDAGDKADVALVTNRDDFYSNGDRTWLYHVADRFKDGNFGSIILSTDGSQGLADETGVMRKILQERGVPASAIIEESSATNTWDMAQQVAAIMEKHEFTSVMIVTNYYRVSRMKLALKHAGVADIKQSHLGSVRLDDSWSIAHEVFALYIYVGKTFVLPAAEKIKEEAKTEADKASVETEKARNSVDKKLDSLPK